MRQPAAKLPSGKGLLHRPHSSSRSACRSTKTRAAYCACVTRDSGDSSKAGDDHLHRFATLDEVDLVVTDTELADDVAAELRAAGPEVVTA